MSYYGLDLEKIEIRFKKALETGSDNEVAEFAKEIIPILIEDSRKTRMEVIDNLLERRGEEL